MRFPVIGILAICFITVFNLSAQTDKAVKAKLQEIEKSGEYIVARGHGSTLRQAQEDALANLASQISSSVSSQFEYLINEKTRNNDIDFNAQVNSIVKTYSHTTLRNALEIIVKDEPDAIIVRYMKKADVDKLFEDRRKRAINYAKEAERYEKEGKVGDALSHYYWALALLRSCPSGDELKINLSLNDERLLSSYIDEQFKAILSQVGVELLSNALENDETRTVGLQAKYKGAPAANFYYTYFNGLSRSELCEMQNGEDAISIPANLRLSDLDIRVEYYCEAQANCDAELRDVLYGTQQVPLPAAKKPLQGALADTAPPQKSLQLVKPAEAQETGTTVVHYLGENEASPYLNVMAQVETAIRSKTYSSVRHLFTQEGYKMFEALVNYGHARLIRNPEVKFSRFNDEVICRSFPMSFSFKTNQMKFSEHVVFHLNRDARITEVAFGLEDRAADDIMNNGLKRYSETARQVLVNFLESYKTAYALRRIDYFEKIFSNDALIITGTVVSSTGTGELQPKMKQHVKYTRQSKSQYLRNLKRAMDSNEFINIRFADNRIKKSVGKEAFGIQIQQSYFSSNYGDTGYLFLLLDLTNQSQPIVRVRAWQPDLDPTIPDGRLDISDFIF